MSFLGRTWNDLELYLGFRSQIIKQQQGQDGFTPYQKHMTISHQLSIHHLLFHSTSFYISFFFCLEKTLSSQILLLYSSTKISLPKYSNLKQYTLNNYCLFEIKKGSIMKEIELPLNCRFWSLWLFSQLQWDFAAWSVANVYQKNGCKQLLQIWASKKCFTMKSQTTIHKLMIIHVI